MENLENIGPNYVIFFLPDPSHSSADTPHTKSSSGKATQLPLKDLLKFIKKKEAANKKQQTTENCHKSGKVQLGASSGQYSNDQACGLLTCISFVINLQEIMGS